MRGLVVQAKAKQELADAEKSIETLFAGKLKLAREDWRMKVGAADKRTRASPRAWNRDRVSL